MKPFIYNYELTADGINSFLSDLKCGNGKHGYYRALRAFCNWLYRNRYVKSNPIENVDAPKQSRRLLPCLNEYQVVYLIEQAGNIRDKAIISLFADSGIRLNELVNIKLHDIDWENRTVTITGKGSKQRKAPFGGRTIGLLRALHVDAHDAVFGLTRRGVMTMLHRLHDRTGLPCNPHTFRRTFGQFIA